MSTEQAEVISRRPRAIRQYTPQERLAAVALYDTVGSLEKASQTLGIPMSTLAGWVQYGDIDSKLRTEKAQDFAQKIENAAHLYLDLAVKKSKKADFHHLMSGFGIAVDKMQLLRGQPTSITSDVHREELLVVMQTAIQDLQVSEAIQVRPEPDQSECVNE